MKNQHLVLTPLQEKQNIPKQNKKLHAAKNAPSTQYLQAFSNLDAAQKAIDDGEIALDRAWAENEVTNAQIPINNVDNVIQWFKANASTRDDAQLPAIVAKREVAVSYISTANDEISNGNYDQARAKAQEAFNKGNESYTDALTRQKDTRIGVAASRAYLTSQASRDHPDHRYCCCRACSCRLCNLPQTLTLG